MTQAQAQETVTHQWPGGEAAALLRGELPRLAHQLGGHHDRVGMAIGGAFGEHVPNGDQQFAGDSDDGNAFRLTPTQAPKLLLPMRMGGDGAPCRFNQHAAPIPPPLLGERALAVACTAGVDVGTQPGIADQAAGRGKTADVADGGQHGHGGDQGEAGQLEQEGGPHPARGPAGSSGPTPLPRPPVAPRAGPGSPHHVACVNAR